MSEAAAGGGDSGSASRIFGKLFFARRSLGFAMGTSGGGGGRRSRNEGSPESSSGLATTFERQGEENKCRSESDAGASSSSAAASEEEEEEMDELGDPASPVSEGATPRKTLSKIPSFSPTCVAAAAARKNLLRSPLVLSGLSLDELAVVRRARADALLRELRAEAKFDAAEARMARIDADAAAAAAAVVTDVDDAAIAVPAVGATAAGCTSPIDKNRPENVPAATAAVDAANLSAAALPASTSAAAVPTAAAATAVDAGIDRDDSGQVVRSHQPSIDGNGGRCGGGGRAEAGRQLEAEQTCLRMGVATHARRGESSEAVIARLQTQLRVLQDDKVVGELMDAAKAGEDREMRLRV
jgi:hypothetical protein